MAELTTQADALSMVFRTLPLLSDGAKQGGKRENPRILARKEQNKGDREGGARNTIDLSK